MNHCKAPCIVGQESHSICTHRKTSLHLPAFGQSLDLPIHDNRIRMQRQLAVPQEGPWSNASVYNYSRLFGTARAAGDARRSEECFHVVNLKQKIKFPVFIFLI
tara:strand:+ start:92 stop:403 length:312 start_codon:yes stop_codon:yes gene_type:complete